MKKICECCGKNVDTFIWEPLKFDGEKVLCKNCAEPIRDDIHYLYHVNGIDEFNLKKGEILNKCKELFDGNITEEIAILIDKICNNSFRNLSTTIIKTESDANSSSGMFSNIGSKIKGLANIFTWMGIVSSVISGIVVMSNDEDLIFIGLLIIGFGCLLSWISSFVLYGFGQLVENTDKLVKH